MDRLAKSSGKTYAAQVFEAHRNSFIQPGDLKAMAEIGLKVRRGAPPHSPHLFCGVAHVCPTSFFARCPMFGGSCFLFCGFIRVLVVIPTFFGGVTPPPPVFGRFYFRPSAKIYHQDEFAKKKASTDTRWCGCQWSGPCSRTPWRLWRRTSMGRMIRRWTALWSLTPSTRRRSCPVQSFLV